MPLQFPRFGSAENFTICRKLAMSWLAIMLLLLLPGEPAAKTTEEDIRSSSGGFQVTPAANIPSEYGEVVYQKDGHLTQQVFIIAQRHRSAITGLPEPETVQVQAEIYRLGEWLIREQQVGLLLPEGFFQKTSLPGAGRSQAHPDRVCPDATGLTNRLSNTHQPVNASLLLSDCYDIRLGQVEDERLYRQIRRLLDTAQQDDSISVLFRIDDLQQQRTLSLLQNIPAAVEETFLAGDIELRRAMFTIGLLHIGQIIDALRNGSFDPAVLSQDRSSPREDYRPVLNLFEQGYGVTVVIPRTLAESQEALRLARLPQE